MKKILSLDLGVSSIGWAYVHEADPKKERQEKEESKIIDLGVRVNPITTDELKDFERGKPITTNANRTLKRAARRNLQRFKQRRNNLIEILKKENWINDNSILTESGEYTTFETYKLRANAAIKQISLEEFTRVLLMINKKRGYKSNRKANNKEEGNLIDGMEVAKMLYNEKITPGQYTYKLLKDGRKNIPDFYRSDLNNEFEKVWKFQQKFQPDLLTESLKKELEGKGQKETSAIFKKIDIFSAENKGNREEKKLQAYKWRSEAVEKQSSKEELVYVLTEINNNINSSSGYLGAISDRSKELYFNKQTVGQYLYNQLQKDKHARLKTQVFYRQDYIDEFEKIWEIQSENRKELTEDLKKKIKEYVILYQRKLKSQKSLISICEFERKERKVLRNGKEEKQIIGLRVLPKSSPLFQEFKIWQILHNINLVNIKTKKKHPLDQDAKDILFEELNIRGNLKTDRLISLLGHKPKEWQSNFKEIEGNRTNEALYDAYLKILDLEGYDEDLLKLSNKDDIKIKDLKSAASEIKEMIKACFETLEIKTEILDFNAELEGKEFQKQLSYQLWHILYSYEEDDSESGNETLYKILENKFGFKKEHSKILANIYLQDDYGNLSAKAIRKIYSYIKENEYSKACELVGDDKYRHSNYRTKEENKIRELDEKLDLLPKNSLRNPVVEKIINQMINLINDLVDREKKRMKSEGKEGKFNFDEIRIELARDLKKSAKERDEMTLGINKAKREHEKIKEILVKEFGAKNPTRKDIIRYKLYEELAFNSYKDLYTGAKIHREKILEKDYDIDHIIPQARLFDDSFSNKTLVPYEVNRDKGKRTAFDYVSDKFGEEGAEAFKIKIEGYYKERKISKAKYQKLLMKESEIGDGFIERDLRNTQYIAKKSREILDKICRRVNPTTGSITDKLREDWGIVDAMKELNLPKYRALGMTEMLETKDGGKKEVIKDWTKRNDHRHHAMDALTIAFTTDSHIQYLNYLNARDDENHEKHKIILAIEDIIIENYIKKNGKRGKRFKSPMPNFRREVKKHLENILVSYKAKNKVVTKNNNIIPSKGGIREQEVLTPRGLLHKETVYSKLRKQIIKEERVSAKFDFETIERVTNPKYRELLLKRLEENNNDPKKAFSGKNALNKRPIYIDLANNIKLPEAVKLLSFEEYYSIRKDITADNFKDYKNIEKVIDEKVRNILIQRLKEHEGNSKEAFSDLEKNPIWYDKHKTIPIKRVTISGINNAEALHYKKNHLGRDILDEKGNRIPVDFVSTGNNHHVAIYRDEKGNLQEYIVSFFEAVTRVNQNLDIIDKNYKKEESWEFLFTMKQNEYFVFPSDDFDPHEIDLKNPENRKIISKNLFRVQAISTKDYFFRHHLETKIEYKNELKGFIWKREGLKGLENIIKIRVNHLGEIVNVGEY